MSRIALIGENSIEYIDKLLDIWNSDNCAVLIDPKVPPKTAVDMMLEAGVNKCYIEQKYYSKIYEIVGKTKEIVSYESRTSSAEKLPSKIYNKFQEKYVEDEAIVIYSSGTTGRSKGIILSHRAINENADAIIDYMQPSESDCMYIVKNLTHSSTITGELLVALKTKMPLLIAPVVMPPRYVLSNIIKFGVTIIGLNPLLLSMYCNECKQREYNLLPLKKIYVSGSILDDKTYAAAHNAFLNQEIYNVYGLSEAGPRVTAQRQDCCKSNSVGKPIKGVEVAIVDDYGCVLENGKRGVIYVNSPSIFSGYVSGEKKHKSIYKNWLNTGDIGYFDEYGELHIVGRNDDMIVIDVHKVYPSEVEKQVQVFADIQECVVTSIKLQAEDVLCCLYSGKTEIQNDIVNKLGKILLKCEIPKVFIKIDKLPRTPNGKISKQNVEKILYAELLRRKANE